MYPRYYGLRRLNPYRGVVMVVEAGFATAHSFDGLTWHLRADDGYGWVRPCGVWVAGIGLKAGQPAALGDLLPALETAPALPFPLRDRLECWLLDASDGLPLALLASSVGQEDETPAPVWHPFVENHSGFHSSTLEAAGISGDHGEFLAGLINRRAGEARWFQRQADGSGQTLPANAFPELLLRETENSRLENSGIADYHAHLAPLLLPWPWLAQATRERLETQACHRPQALARVHRLLPAVLDAARLKAALVAARLEQANSEPD